MITLICSECGKNFEVCLSRKDTAKYCSCSCAQKHRWKIPEFRKNYGKGHPHSKEWKENMSKSMKKWHKKVGFSEETKRKIGKANSIALKGKILPLTQRLKQSESMKGRNPWKYFNNYEQARQNLSNSKKGLKLSEDTWKKIYDSRKNSPNKPETYLINLFSKLNLNYTFVGNGKLIVDNLCPDFVNYNNNKIIEFFGNYWHDEEDVRMRSERFAKCGYTTLVIWEDELKDEIKLINKINKFEQKANLSMR